MHKVIEEVYRAQLIPNHDRYFAKVEYFSGGLRIEHQSYLWGVHGVEIWLSFLTLTSDSTTAQWDIKREW